MNPFITAIAAVLFKQKRKCPKCMKDQIVPLSKRHDSVPCKFCGNQIPAKR